MKQEIDLSWLKGIHEAGYIKRLSEILQEFSRTIDPLKIEENFISGHILVIGPATAFPERIFLMDSTLRNFLNKISSATICDIDPAAIRIDGCVLPNRYFRNGDPLLQEKDVVGCVWGNAEDLLSRLDKPIFDTILAFRNDNFREQFGRLTKLVLEKGLKRGGLFIGSGDFISREAFVSSVSPGLSIVRITELPNPDFTGYTYGSLHLGFIIAKD